MLKRKNYLGGLFLTVVLVMGGSACAQKSMCKVLVPSLSEEYNGGCKKGLAHGKGFAKGKDTYSGQFSKGLPHGKGDYTWADGTLYKGQWSGGQREGKGTMVFKVAGKDSVVTGYWKKNKYIGEKLVRPYKIDRKHNVTRYSIVKASDANSNIRIKLLKAGGYNTDVEDFSLAYDSGEEYALGNMTAIQNIIFPSSVSVKYRTWNHFHTSQYDVIFEFTINEPGTWEVTIGN